MNLPKNYDKKFTATVRDSLTPDPKNWKLEIPQNNSLQPLQINFGESLDYSLLLETLTVITEKGHKVSGKWIIAAKEKGCQFVPGKNWQSGNYKLKIETRLEDLAGNNLNRSFDRDVTKKETAPKTEDFVEMQFRVVD